MGNIIFHPKKLPVTQAARIGPRNELTALTNCPRVNAPVNLSFATTSVTNGLSETCNRVLPIPIKANAINMAVKSYATSGRHIANTWNAKLSSTVFLRPMRFINIPVGIESTRNHKKQDREMRLTIVSVRWLKSFFT